MYQCHNKPRPTHNDTQLVQDGWLDNVEQPGHVLVRRPKMKAIKFVMTIPCAYDRSATDKRCDGCKFKKEKQDAKP